MQIKAIAFDLVRVLVQVNDTAVTPLEFKLSEAFDYKVGDELYWDWAVRQTGRSLAETKEICREIINKRYAISEPDLFTKIPSYKFSIASNHLSLIGNWLKEKGFYDYFYCHVISEEVKCQKPERKFYEIVAERLGEDPANILFIDDKEQNVAGASDFGMQTLHYNGKRSLSEEINNLLK